MIPKYRGLSIDEKSKGECQYGYLIADDKQVFILNEVIEANEQYITIGSWCPVDPETVGQSTGLVDKNGKEIFEGDILAIETDEGILNVNIFWDSKHALFMFESKKHNEKDLLAELAEDNTYPFEIAGNIYENPELLLLEVE